MPLVWQDNEVAMEYSGVKIYHTYRNDNMEERYDNHYAVDASGDASFDIREIECPAWLHPDDHEAILSYAIDLDLLPVEYDDNDFNDYQVVTVFELPDDHRYLHPHLLAKLLHEYDEYILAANEEDKYESGWRPVSVREFYTEEFQQILREEGYFNGEKDIPDDGGRG